MSTAKLIGSSIKRREDPRFIFDHQDQVVSRAKDDFGARHHLLHEEAVELCVRHGLGHIRGERLRRALDLHGRRQIETHAGNFGFVTDLR